MVNEQLINELREELNTLTQTYNKNADDLETCFKLGKVYSKMRKFEEAITFYKKALVIKPEEISLNLNIGLCYSELKDYSSALYHYKKILKHDDTSQNFLKVKAGAYLNSANINFFHNKFDKAIEILEHVIEIRPEHSNAYVNLGLCYSYKNDKKKAIDYFKKALELDNSDLDAIYNLAYTQLSVGDFENGFKNYECRVLSPKTAITTEYLTFKKPRWQGEDLCGKTIFIHHEQGLGDAIQFSRFFYELKQQGANVLYNAPIVIADLFKGSEIVCPELIPFSLHKTDKNFESRFDYYLPLMSLPCVMNIKPDTIPLSAPYICPDFQKVQIFKKLFQKYTDKIKIGINWQGNLNGDPKRIIKPEEFYTLCDVPNVTLFSFQKGAKEIIDTSPDINIVDLEQHLNDFSDTAAALTNMDLLISNDSAMAHLGGAMGIKTWILLPYFPEWRWGINSNCSWWYDSVRLFRQKTIDNWTEVFQEVKKELLNKFKQS